MNKLIVTKSDWEEYFPYKSIRKSQEKVIDFVLNSFLGGKKYVIAECPTGVGKSAIGYTVSRFLNEMFDGGPEDEIYQPGSYFLTTQIILQDQYVTDFPHMVSIKGSSNYKCKRFYTSCKEGKKILSSMDEEKRINHPCNNNCAYSLSKFKFLAASKSVTNLTYFLTETFFVGKIRPRNLMIVDECHNIDDEMSNLVKVVVSANFVENQVGIKFPEPLSTAPAAISWLKGVYLGKLNKKSLEMENNVESFDVSNEGDVEKFILLTKKSEEIQIQLQKVKRFLKNYQSDNWVFEKSGRGIEFSPIDVSEYCRERLFKFGDRVLLMSATILGKKGFCERTGIPQNEAGFLSVDSPFPVEIRPIVYSGIGKMNRNSIDDTMQKMIPVIKMLMEYHSKEKGIIHTHTYKIAEMIKEAIGGNRLLVHTSKNRLLVLNKHKLSKTPTILLSPSMQEGVDLKDNLSRFQIVCKIPFPYLGSELVKKKKEKWDWWYATQTAKTIIQSIGRSVRHKEDFAATYILDESWGSFYRNNSGLFSKDFRRCLSA